MQATAMREDRAMKQFKTILGFELKYFFKNKVFVGVTVFLVALIAVVMFFPRVKAAFDKPDTPVPGGDTEVSDTEDGAGGTDAAADSDIMLIASDTPETAEQIKAVFSEAFTGYSVRIAEGGADEIKEKILSGDAECGFVMSGLSSYTYYVDNLSMYDYNTEVADELLQTLYRTSAMLESGVPQDRINDIFSFEVTHETESLGKDQMQNFFYTYIMIFALYMVILLYGQLVATNVATEKSSRAMELLITSAKPVSMMFGKVIASCIAGFIQLVCIFGSAFVFFNLNKTYWGGNEIISSIFNMPVGLLLYMLMFFVLGFLMYAFMFGAVGSTASKVEDINTSVMPLTMLFVIGFIVVMMSMSSGNVDNTLMKVCSYIPFTSPMALFTRIAMSTVPAYEIVISVVILIASVFGIGVLAAKIYRMGVLLYGKAPKLGEILRSVRKA